MNPTAYADAFKVAGMAMMALGAGLLIFVATLFLKKKPECNCDD